MLRAHHGDRVSVVKYCSKQQPPMSLTGKTMLSSLQNNNNNAYYVELSSGSVNNNNNKNNTYVVRACRQEVKYHISLESLIEAYYDCRKNKKSKNECVRFSYRKEEYLTELKESIEVGAYKPYPSKAFIVTYPTYREVFAADFRDRIIHHWIALRLEPLMEEKFIDDSYNCRKGRGTSYGVKRAVELLEEKTCHWTREAYVMKWDLSGYFMSIDKRILWRKLVKLIDDNYKCDDIDVLKYLTYETLFNKPQNNCIRTSAIEEWDKLDPAKSLFNIVGDIGLPIGNLTSQLFANFYLSDVDSKMKSMEDGYCRYVDDGWIIGTDKKQMLNALRVFKDEAKKLHIKLHKKKFYIQDARKGIKLIGVVIKPHRVYAANRTIGRAITTLMSYGKKHVDCETIDKLVASTNSYLGFLNDMVEYKNRTRILKSIPSKWHCVLVSEKNRRKINRRDIMNTINIITTDRKLLTAANGTWALHFGHKKTDNNSYECIEITYRFKPTLQLLNKHIQSAGHAPITEEQFKNNEV